MTVRRYRNEIIPSLAGNPLIEALPERLEPAQVIASMMERKEYFPAMREENDRDRLSNVQTILRLYQPSEKDVELYYQIVRCLYWGYADRNPLSGNFARMVNEEYQAYRENEVSVQYSSFHPVASGFALIGISGLGKSSAIRKCLSLFPQVIRHQMYRNIPFNETQVVWLHIDCPSDGGLKGLCGSFFEAIDDLVGTDYAIQYDERRTTLNRMRIAMSRVVRTYHVGMLVIDEIQSLCVAKDNSIPVKTLNFLVELVNKIGIPVLLVGTPRALSFLQKEFQQAKRASGQGDALWEPMKNGSDWEIFLRSIWTYQYTREEVPLSKEFIDAMYKDSAGVPFLAVHIYKLTQEKAILSRKESFSAADLHKVASKKMRLTKEMVTAILSGKDVNLGQYLDLAAFTEKDFVTAMASPAENGGNASIPSDEARHKARPEDLRAAAVNALLAFGVHPKDAQKHVDTVLAKMPSCTDSAIIARESYHSYIAASNHNDDDDGNPAKGSRQAVTTGYEANLSNGNIGI